MNGQEAKEDFAATVSLNTKMISASIGALLTSLVGKFWYFNFVLVLNFSSLVTPLDVVKVRIQTQTFHNGSNAATRANMRPSAVTSIRGMSNTFPSSSNLINVYSIPYQYYRTAMLRYASSPYIYCSELFDHVEPYFKKQQSISSDITRAKFSGTFVSLKYFI